MLQTPHRFSTPGHRPSMDDFRRKSLELEELAKVQHFCPLPPVNVLNTKATFYTTPDPPLYMLKFRMQKYLLLQLPPPRSIVTNKHDRRQCLRSTPLTALPHPAPFHPPDSCTTRTMFPNRKPENFRLRQSARLNSWGPPLTAFQPPRER